MLDKLVNLYDDIAKGGRIQDLEQLAVEHRLPFISRQLFGIQTTDIKGFKLFSKKGTKRLIGIMSISTQQFKGSIRFYDYLNTKDLETSTHSVIEIYCENLYNDYFIIEPKGAFKKMKGLFTRQRKEFPQLKEFYSRFLISTRDPDALSVLKESALDLMIDFRKITCESEGNYFLFYRRKKEINVHDILPTVEFAEEFVRLIHFDHSGEYV